MTMTLSPTEVYSQELQATVTPPSSESENLMRNVPTSLAFRNSSASCRETNPSKALNKMFPLKISDDSDQHSHPSIHIPLRSSLVSFITA